MHAQVIMKYTRVSCLKKKMVVSYWVWSIWLKSRGRAYEDLNHGSTFLFMALFNWVFIHSSFSSLASFLDKILVMISVLGFRF